MRDSVERQSHKFYIFRFLYFNFSENLRLEYRKVVKVITGKRILYYQCYTSLHNKDTSSGVGK